MNWDLLVVVSMLILIGFFIFLVNNSNLNEEPAVYQGPIPEGYDEDHFRKTGETIPLENG